MATEIPENSHLKRFDQNKAAMLRALENHLGNVTMAAAEIGMSRRTHYLWMAEDSDYAEAANELKNVAVDFYEQALHERIKAGSDAAVIFALKTQGRSRGWQERQELKVEHNYSDMSDEEIAALIEAKRKEAE
jgi:hypothetical protein